MLTAESSWLLHSLQNLTLIALSLALFPLNTLLLAIAFYRPGFKKNSVIHHRDVIRSKPDFQPRRILVTGVGMTKGLALARLFYSAGHDVIGADFRPGNALACGQVSKAVRKFYQLEAPSPEHGSSPYLQSLLDIVNKEKVELWVSCSGVASAVEDGMAMQVIEARTACRAVQFDAATTQTLHEKHSFIQRTQDLGLTVPETVQVTSADQVEAVLRAAPRGRKYIMKTVGMDDSVRGDMTLLPRSTWKETQRHISRLRISRESPWIVQQFIDGLEFCTHSLVVRGQVKAFVACPSAELLMHYESLPPNSALSRAMLEFTHTFAEKSGPGFTGHLSFDFLVEWDDLHSADADAGAGADAVDGKDGKNGREVTLYPIECNPRAHTAVALFNDTLELADAYLSVLPSPSSSSGHQPTYADIVDPDPARNVIFPRDLDTKYYWIGHDLFTLLLVPAVEVLMFRTSVLEFARSVDLLLDHLLTWKDGTFESWDPFPCWWLYQVYWPLRFVDMWRRGRKWSRVNVSTGKMFEC